MDVKLVIFQIEANQEHPDIFIWLCWFRRGHLCQHQQHHSVLCYGEIVKFRVFSSVFECTIFSCNITLLHVLSVMIPFDPTLARVRLDSNELNMFTQGHCIIEKSLLKFH